MGHDHDHAVAHRAQAVANRRRLALVACGGLVVLAAEVAGGIASGSLVLLADAAHYLTDILSVLLALLAVQWSLRAPTGRKTFGHHRGEVLMAFVQAVALWGVSVAFLVFAAFRLHDPPPVEGSVILVVGVATLLANVGLALTLRGAAGKNLNVRAAYLHILSDVLGSAAAILAGFLAHQYGWAVADPLLTVLVTVLILAYTWRLTRQTLHILMEGTPEHLEADEVRAAILEVPGVAGVHDLHLWSHAPGHESLTVHVVVQQGPPQEPIMHAIHRRIGEGFGVRHVTVQLESPECPCDTLRHSWGAD
ncbi:MAG: cobalt-zinc-cadmium efflux system protein [Thermoplasmata archaeon]|jgi:cobalt-zinc-cadmium efflux system protein|nr:cobalt-zinc-cadmium efflux system protein [Thermoplasmata archaeon]